MIYNEKHNYDKTMYFTCGRHNQTETCSEHEYTKEVFHSPLFASKIYSNKFKKRENAAKI